MAALEPEYMEILKKALDERFVPYLPPLLDTSRPPVEQQEKQLSRAFSAFVLHKLLDIPAHVASAAVVDDFNDKGIDAVHYDEKSETLYLLQTKLKASDQFNQGDALPFCEGVRLLIRKELAEFNQNFQNRRTQIEAALDDCSHIKLVVPYTGDGISGTAENALRALIRTEKQDEERLESAVSYYTAADIVRDLLAEKAYKPVHADLYLLKSEKVENPRVTYYGIARLSDLVGLHAQHGKALYERNIRYFLGSSKSNVNKAIKTTLHDAPSDFFYLNNGVTAVCDLMEPKGKTTGFRTFKVRGLSIINGAQTVASAAEFVAQHPGRDISDAKVMFTLIKAPADAPFGKLVTKARNHQNPVQGTNFASLDENQERLRQGIAHLGYTYHYRPEASASGDLIIALDDAMRALALLQHNPRYAVWLKSEPARLADPESSDYQALFPESLQGMVLVNTVNFHRTIRALILSYEQTAPARSLERLVYRHASYVIAAVMMKRLRQRIGSATVIDPATMPALISQPLDQLRQHTFDLSQQHLANEGPLAYFRNMQRTIPFLIELMKLNFNLSHFRAETNADRLNRLAAENKDLADDLAERLSKAAPQI